MLFQKREKRVYLDHAAATPLDSRVKSAIEEALAVMGNPASLHQEGVAARAVLEAARESVAKRLRVPASSIFFTSGGTESNNLAIMGAVRALEETGKKISEMHFIVSAIEHPSVMDCFTILERHGARVSSIEVSEEGLVDPKTVGTAITPETVLVSIAYVNGEIGTVQPIAEIAKEIRRKSKALNREAPLFHTDASQAFLFYPCEPLPLHVDLMTLDGQKIYGPKGVGVLYRSVRAPLTRLFEGGGQEGGLRPGTENVPLIVGFEKALSLVPEDHTSENRRLLEVREYGLQQLLEAVPEAVVNGSREERAPNNINISIPGMDGEFLVLALDARGFAVGTGSACLASKGDSSYVIRALGKGKETAAGTLRITIGRETTKADLKRLAEALRTVVSIQRRI